MKYKTSFPERLSVWFWARHTDWDLKSPIKPTFEFNCIFLQQVTLKAEASSLLTQYAGKTLKLLSSMPKCVNVKAGSEHSYKWSWQLKGQKMIDSGYTQLEETKILWRRVQCIRQFWYVWYLMQLFPHFQEKVGLLQHLQLFHIWVKRGPRSAMLKIRTSCRQHSNILPMTAGHQYIMEDMDELGNRKRKWTVRESLGFFARPSNHQPHPEREERKRKKNKPTNNTTNTKKCPEGKMRAHTRMEEVKKQKETEWKRSGVCLTLQSRFQK